MSPIPAPAIPIVWFLGVHGAGAGAEVEDIPALEEREDLDDIRK